MVSNSGLAQIRDGNHISVITYQKMEMFSPFLFGL